jgi:hypothetical protein
VREEFTNKTEEMRLTRIVFASDFHENYIQFWGLTSRVWRHVTGAKPTLFLVGNESDAIVDIPFTDVIRVPKEPFEGLPTCFVAQMIRLLAPIWFPFDTCVIADIDLLVLQNQFFTKYLKDVNPSQLVVLNRYNHTVSHSSLCYHIATGKTFSELFDVKLPMTPSHRWALMADLCQKWWTEKKGQWSTDEMILHQHVDAFRKKFPTRVTVHNTPELWANPTHTVSHYQGFKFDPSRSNRYIEMEPPFPYVQHREQIHAVLRRLLPALFPELDTAPLSHSGHPGTNRHPHKKSTKGAESPNPAGGSASTSVVRLASNR